MRQWSGRARQRWYFWRRASRRTNTRGHPAPLAPETSARDLELKAGLNVVLLKIASTEGNWKGKVWLKDSAGKSLKGIKVTLDPEGRK